MSKYFLKNILFFVGLLFVDDLMILGRTNEEIYQKLEILQRWCDTNKMERIFGKTKILDEDKDQLWPVMAMENIRIDREMKDHK